MKITGSTPDVTPAQIAALVTFVVGQLVEFGWVDGSKSQTLVSVGSTLVALVWKLADAYLRGQRAHAVAANPSLSSSEVPKA